MDTSSELAIEVADPHDGVLAATVRLTGTLDRTDGPMLATRLCVELRERHVLIVDVAGLAVAQAGAVHAFADAMAQAGEWPEVRMVLAGPDPALALLLDGSRVAQRFLVRPDAAGAAAALDQRPELVGAFWHFDVSSHAPGTARAHIRRVCDRWTVDPEVREAAEIVVTELVTNAVEHATSRSVVEVERRAGSFRMTVRDYDTSTLPEAVLPPPSSARGRGLGMVAAISREWGVHHHSDGKTVWAEMTTA